MVGISLKQVNPNQRARVDYINLTPDKKKEENSTPPKEQENS